MVCGVRDRENTDRKREWKKRPARLALAILRARYEKQEERKKALAVNRDCAYSLDDRIWWTVPL